MTLFLKYSAKDQPFLLSENIFSNPSIRNKYFQGQFSDKILHLHRLPTLPYQAIPKLSQCFCLLKHSHLLLPVKSKLGLMASNILEFLPFFIVFRIVLWGVAAMQSPILCSTF